LSFQAELSGKGCAKRQDHFFFEVIGSALSAGNGAKPESLTVSCSLMYAKPHISGKAYIAERFLVLQKALSAAAALSPKCLLDFTTSYWA